MIAIGYSYAIRLLPTYILNAIKVRFLWRFHPGTLKSERLVCVETDTHMARSSRLVMMIKKIYILYGIGNVSSTALEAFLCKGITRYTVGLIIYIYALKLFFVLNLFIKQTKSKTLHWLPLWANKHKWFDMFSFILRPYVNENRTFVKKKSVKCVK